MEHKVLPAQQVSAPSGKDGMWRAACTCGEYLSGFNAYPSHAERSVQAHADAKNAKEE